MSLKTRLSNRILTAREWGLCKYTDYILRLKLRNLNINQYPTLIKYILDMPAGRRIESIMTLLRHIGESPNVDVRTTWIQRILRTEDTLVIATTISWMADTYTNLDFVTEKSLHGYKHSLSYVDRAYEVKVMFVLRAEDHRTGLGYVIFVNDLYNSNFTVDGVWEDLINILGVAKLADVLLDEETRSLTIFNSFTSAYLKRDLVGLRKQSDRIREVFAPVAKAKGWSKTLDVKLGEINAVTTNNPSNIYPFEPSVDKLH